MGGPAYNGCPCSCHRGDPIMHYVACCHPEDGEDHLIKIFEDDMTIEKFSTYADVPGLRKCKKLPVEVQAVQIDHKFRVDTLEGAYKEGQPGDYLIKGADGELYACAQHIFKETYEWVEEEKDEEETK